MFNRRIAVPAMLAAGLSAGLTFGALSTHVDRTSHLTPVPAQCEQGTTVDAECTYAWQVWDYSGGAHSLKVDTSRGFRVDYVGSSSDYPRGITDTEVALVGKDGNWYVFRAQPTS